METVYIQSVTTGRIYPLMKSAAERQLKSGKFIRVDEARVERIKASMAR